ncbi:pilus assembly PilX family protein [Xanthomonas graminis]|jgi:type IV pilus assembly protein PilX|uniref:Type IV pilus assembly protein PilX n=1 Tax=Xanthomonas graminis pv. graminis TaxID=134874 RepID=A0A1M4IKZ3_9XANT|nr:PilX N-terminal domain-containing pilus assembly protein [Xanthomonas translucens]EKU25034.1 Tfp pilus assembly protein PilX [Xanthomonas translucens pv. graminis ART-Xtg29]OAX59765.1 pilus assembly protein [Xanthomonas translucens pv. graminis]UKE52963.1 pilus assembly protein [Xanthomonas translucens pv. graminis]WIH10149.1 pilus assembly protein [Xanthomonas translucens pv. graminis]WIH13549.1 pilus assembly protein [Xanthomonas translucens pv. graminis]
MNSPFPCRQGGISLLVVLLLLLVMTLLGLAVMRNTLLEERMASNLVDRGRSFQAVEGALREAEARIGNANPLTMPSSGCTNGLCAPPVATDPDRWLSSDRTGWSTATLGVTTTAAPRYIIEYMGEAPTWPACDRISPIPQLCMAPSYRITAVSEGAGRAQVLLQTNYIKQ